MSKRLVIINNCSKECPYVKTERTAGAGYAEDYFCTKAKKVNGKFRMIAGYVEWDSDLPKPGEFPKWCPLFEPEEGMFKEE
mgnify:CR=1 FL=1